jgi:hypothetical protein
MHELFHVMGICPDSWASQNFINIFISNYQETINLINQGYDKIKSIF